MIYNILKTPYFENDSALLQFKLLPEEFNPTLQLLNDYTLTKLKAFEQKNINKQQFQKFKDRPSLRNYDNIKDLYGSIYTHTCGMENFVTEFTSLSYNSIPGFIIRMVFDKNGSFTGSRRCFLRIANDFARYLFSDDQNLDVSCLAGIHYYKNYPRIIFRASDIKNEFFTDVVTIYQFFIKPIYKYFNIQLLNIEFYLSTCQNINELELTLKKIQSHFNVNSF